MMLALALPALADARIILKGHTLGLGSLAYSADGLHVATASYDRTAKVWDAIEPTKIRLSVELCATYWHFLLIVWLAMFYLLLTT